MSYPKLQRINSRSQAMSLGDIAKDLRLLPSWQLQIEDDVARLLRRYTFSSYLAGARYCQGLAAASEQLDHHPKLVLEWCRVDVSWWTHKIGGVHANDFMMAQFSDRLYLEIGSQN